MVPHTSFFNYNITRPYQTTYYFAIEEIFTSYTSIRRGPYLVPGPNQAKKWCHTPHFLTTISRDRTKQHIILPYTKYLYLTRVEGGAPIWFLIQVKLEYSATHLIFQLQYHESLPNNTLFCRTQNIYILHEIKERPLFVSWSKSS